MEYLGTFNATITATMTIICAGEAKTMLMTFVGMDV